MGTDHSVPNPHSRKHNPHHSVDRAVCPHFRQAPGLTSLFLLLFFLAPLPAQDVRHLTILHSNDLHAHLLPDDMGRGGFAYLASAVRHERENCPACLYLNAGDLVQGTPVSTLFRGTPIYQIGNLLGFDAACVGNHEFDYGWQAVQRFAKIANYPLLAANVFTGPQNYKDLSSQLKLPLRASADHHRQILRHQNRRRNPRRHHWRTSSRYRHRPLHTSPARTRARHPRGRERATHRALAPRSIRPHHRPRPHSRRDRSRRNPSRCSGSFRSSRRPQPSRIRENARLRRPCRRAGARVGWRPSSAVSTWMSTLPPRS